VPTWSGPIAVAPSRGPRGPAPCDSPGTSPGRSPRAGPFPIFPEFGRIFPKSPRPTPIRRACSFDAAKNPGNLTRGLGMKRYSSLGSAAVLSLSLLAGTPSFGKGGGHAGGHGHSGGGGHAHSSGGGHSSGGHAHSSDHPSGEHHSTGHAASSHSAHPQLTHKSPTHPQTYSSPTHSQPTPGQGTAQHVAGRNSTANYSSTHASGGWHHGHYGWGAWADGVDLPWDYNPNWNGPPGVVVVPQETEIVNQEYVTRLTPPPPQPVPSQNQPAPSENSDGNDSAQVNTAP
jgi:hypothetical protein